MEFETRSLFTVAACLFGCLDVLAAERKASHALSRAADEFRTPGLQRRV